VLNILNNNKLVFCFLIFFLAIGNSIAEVAELGDAAIVAESSAPKKVVIDFQNSLLDAMKQGGDISFQARSDQLEVAILKSHGVIKSLRTIVGSKEWNGFSEEQKNQLSNVFTKFIVSTYASNFNKFSNESFVYVSEHTTKKGNVIVRSILNIPEGKRNKVTFDYALKKQGDNWKIYNIAADGVSDLATRRSEYRRILANDDGFNSLIAIINKKIDNYAKQ
jgi:phospholipid transport system substrate-binding protein